MCPCGWPRSHTHTPSLRLLSPGKAGGSTEVPEEEEEAVKARPVEGEDCPICYEAMSEAGEKTTFCAACRNNMHEVWIREQEGAAGCLWLALSKLRSLARIQCS